jgi:predicted nucleic acid-binding Zn ribbon protein
MPQCPICNAAIWIGQRYCSTCHNYLPNTEEEDHFCPQCGIRVAPQQEICPKCNARLMEMAGTASSCKRSSRVLIFIATGLAIVALLWLPLRHQKPGPPQLLVAPPPQAGSEQTPAAAPMPTAETAPSAPAAQEPPGPSVPAIPAPLEETTPAPSPPRYSVKVHSLALRASPTNSAPQNATLNFQDEVELLDTAGGWGKVRDVRRNIVGWSYMHYLQPVAADDPRAVP